jgi:hypothetical protein
MDDLTFVNLHSQVGEAAITVFHPDGTNFGTIQFLDVEIINQRCPLLAMCFEDGSRGPHHCLEASSRALVVSFLRYIYTGDYMPDHIAAVDEPCSLLIHAELCRLGDVFEAPELMVQAHCNMIQATELACSQPHPPLDLHDAIRFIYGYLSEQRELIDTILHYCISCFIQHGLANNEEFRRLAYELRPFHNDLCRTNFRRGFEDEGAIDIINLPVREATPHSTIAEQKAALGDFLSELFGDWTPVGTPQFGPTMLSPEPTYAIVHRPKKPLDHPTIYDSEDSISDGSLSDTEGFSLVHRPMGKSEESQDNFEGTESGWVGESRRRDRTVGFYSHEDTAGSTATIRPLLRTETYPNSVAEDSYSSDSDWSVVDAPVTRRKGYV